MHASLVYINQSKIFTGPLILNPCLLLCMFRQCRDEFLIRFYGSMVVITEIIVFVKGGLMSLMDEPEGKITLDVRILMIK